MTLQKAMISSKSNEWSTPQDFFDKLDEEFDFDLDVAATNKNKKCDIYFDSDNNGLIQDWHNLSSSACWMNPPYGGHTSKWIKKAYEESKKGAKVVCLLVASTDRSYWHDYIFPYAAQIRFIRGRLKFGNSKYSAPFASAVIVFWKKPHPYKEKIVYSPRS